MKLKHKSHITVAECREPSLLHRNDVSAVIQHFTAVGRLKRTDYLQQCSLARTARTDDREKLPVGNSQAHIIQHFKPVVALINITDFNHKTPLRGRL